MAPIPPGDAVVAVAEDLAAAALSLARRFAAGATMWCVAPTWPSHARHVAVEFVHPVIVGKRALPAVSVEASGAGAASALRQLARPGDVLLALGTMDDEVVADLLPRAEAWGLTSVWIGAGGRGGAVAPRADHVVWLEHDDAAVAAHSGDLVLLYHLLWELTHLVFEHPGLLADSHDADRTPCADDVCITCSDEGRVAEVRALLDQGRLEVLAGGHAELVDGRLVGGLRPGDLVLVHAGVAVTPLTGDDG